MNQDGRRATPERREYAIDRERGDRAATVLAADALLDVLRPHLGHAVIDAYSDYRDELPEDVARAERALRERGARRRRGDPGMGIELDPADDEQWMALRTFAAWSIHVELSAESGRRHLATLHDCGSSIWAELTDAEAVLLTARLVGVASVVPGEVALARRQAEKVESKAARRAARRRRIRAFLRRG